MDYATFYQRFGGSVRTKNISTGPALFAPQGDRLRNLRVCSVPDRSELPKEFIRLCPWEMEYLFGLASHIRKGIIETGRFNGGSAFVMACAAPSVPIYSIDIQPQNDELLLQLFQQHGVGQNVDLIVGDSQRTKYPQIGQVDLLFVDGDHSYQGCSNDLANWYDNLAPNGHLLIHDCYAAHSPHGGLGGFDVQKAVVDFLSQHNELQIVQSPFIGSSYWHYPAGSLAHFIKRAA